MSAAGDLLRSLGVGDDDASQVQSDFQIAYVDTAYTTGLPKIRFAGESSVGSRLYPHLGSYTPAAGDKVLVVLLSHSGVILGKIVES